MVVLLWRRKKILIEESKSKNEVGNEEERDYSKEPTKSEEKKTDMLLIEKEIFNETH